MAATRRWRVSAVQCLNGINVSDREQRFCRHGALASIPLTVTMSLPMIRTRIASLGLASLLCISGAALAQQDREHGDEHGQPAQHAAPERGAPPRGEPHKGPSGYHRVSLETGTTPGFTAARAMYEAAGFRPAAPFADYVRTGDNTFYALTLQPA